MVVNGGIIAALYIKSIDLLQHSLIDLFSSQKSRNCCRIYFTIQITLRTTTNSKRASWDKTQEILIILFSMAASIIMSTVYGYQSAPRNDPFIDNGDRAITIMTNSMFPGASLINSIPFLKYLPSWAPGSRFQQQAEECRRLTREMLDLPFDFVKKNMVREPERDANLFLIFYFMSVLGERNRSAINYV
jgi:hypothetical protein